MRRISIYLALLLITGFGFFPSCTNTDEKVVFLVRHAEKDLSDSTDNPPLTEEGLNRALRLKSLLSDYPITSIFSTRYDRNLNTVRPLADSLNLSVKLYEWYSWQPVLDDFLSGKSGHQIVICGHGDNLLPMIEYLKAEPPLSNLGPHEYDKIFKVVIKNEASLVEMLTY